MWRYIALGAIVIGVVALGFSLIDVGSTGDISASTFLLAGNTDLSGFERAIEPYDWQFPQDFGPHSNFQTEWWYYTGNLTTDSGRRFGFQFTIFRRAIAPTQEDSTSEWRTNQVYLAHFTLSDIEGNQFYQLQRFSRGSADLAGASSDPFTVWLEGWQISTLNDDAMLTNIIASSDEVSIDLTLEQVKPPALHGDEGLSSKSDQVGNASYYYSLARLLTDGTVTISGESFRVEGATWMDHEFSTSALGSDAQGWDWFGLHLDDNRELMLGQIRLMEGGIEPLFGGSLIESDGSVTLLTASDISIEVLGTWHSPHTGADYPAGWELTIDVGADEPLRLTVMPLLADQELTEGIAYWEGAVRISGDVTGYGYAELTGYVGTLNGRF